jgi:regulator of sigma E protease
MFVDKSGVDNLGGPVAISSMAKSSLVAGLDTFLQFLALISISLGVMNLIPLPVLDGGQALITFVEWGTKRRIPPKIANVMQQVGVAFILLLTFFALKNDITRLL